MAREHPVIVTCAVTGAVHVPSLTPYLPITPADVVEASVQAAAAGAAIVHLHARDPQTGKPTPDPDVFAQFLPAIASRCDAVINLTTGGGQGMSLDERLAAARRFRPEVCSLNMGSINFGTFQMIPSIKEFRWPWERDYLEASRDSVFKNTFADIEVILSEFSQDGTRFEFECYDVGHLYTLAHYLDRGLVTPPLFVQAVLGVLGGIGPDPANLLHMKSVADHLFGHDYLLSVLGAGRHQMRLTTLSGILGGNVRVGLEDSIYLARGTLARSNADQVTKITRILRELSLEIATPDQARQLLRLKGADRTAIK